MGAISIGDRVWCQFVNVDNARTSAWVYPMEVVHITESGDLVCRDDKLERTRLVDETVETVSRSETEAWRACQVRLQSVASELIRLADECGAKAKGACRVVA